jgi:hypothetical protein
MTNTFPNYTYSKIVTGIKSPETSPYVVLTSGDGEFFG